MASHLVALQARHVPHRTYLAKVANPPWLGFRCREAAEAKQEAWRRSKQHLSHHNLTSHRTACKWASKHLEQVMKNKLAGPGVDDQTW